jgi:aldehyde:ferredoxin oxidoreductase
MMLQPGFKRNGTAAPERRNRMENTIKGYHGNILEVDLSNRTAEKKKLAPDDLRKYLGGRGLGMKLLWDALEKPGVDPLSPENPLLFMPGPFSGYPIPSSSRTCVVTKSPHTAARRSPFPHASTISYANMGGFFGPEIRFAGYDGLMIRGKASSPVYIVIDDDRVTIEQARSFWGMGTDEFDRRFTDVLGDRRFHTCYIGPAGENLVRYACIINTAGRAAGRGGVGCVMGSKNLKAIAIRGSRMPAVADHRRFLEILENLRKAFTGITGSKFTNRWRSVGTAGALEASSKNGTMAVRNYREGTFLNVKKIGATVAKQKVWIRNFACFCCPLSCKKSGRVGNGPYQGIVHDGPEYETGTMLGANLMIDDMGGMLKAIFMGDDYGIDIISAGNVIGFLMEAYEKGCIDRKFLDGIDLSWGNVEATLQMLRKIVYREGIGDLAAQGVRECAERIGKDSDRFAIHVKGHELAAWNVHADPARGICYVTANRGACHLNGKNSAEQNMRAIHDSLGLCIFATNHGRWYLPGIGTKGICNMLTAITGIDWREDELMRTGERIFTLERMFNCREGFRREDDVLPGRFFEEPLTVGEKKGAVLKRDAFNEMLDGYYKERDWELSTGKPTETKLRALGLAFTLS